MMNRSQMFIVLLCTTSLTTAWYHEMGVEKHVGFYHKRVTRKAGQHLYVLHLAQSCLPQSHQASLTSSILTTRHLIANLYRCIHVRRSDCFLPEFETRTTDSCPPPATSRAPCGHITFRTQQSSKENQPLLVCSWRITERHAFTVNLTLLTVNLPYIGNQVHFPHLAVIPDSGHTRYLYGESPPVTFLSKSMQLSFFGSGIIETHIRAIFHIIPHTGMLEHRYYQPNLFYGTWHSQFYLGVSNQLWFYHLQVYVRHVVRLTVSSAGHGGAQYAIFDGPGVLSKQITPHCHKACIYLSRTYQLFVIHGRAKTPGNTSVSFEPHTQDENIYSDDCHHYEIPYEDRSNVRFVVTKDSIEKAFGKYGSYKCTDHFLSSKGAIFYSPFASLQLTIEQFSYDGYTFHEDFMMPCTYGGIHIFRSFYEVSSRFISFHGESHFCESLAENRTVTISAERRLLFAFFVYQGYSTATLEATFRFSSCWETFMPWPSGAMKVIGPTEKEYLWLRGAFRDDNTIISNCFLLNMYPFNRFAATLIKSNPPSRLYNFGTLALLSIMTHRNPLQYTVPQSFLEPFIDRIPLQHPCASPRLATLTFFRDFNENKQQVFLEDRPGFVLETKATSLLVELSMCEWRYSAIVIMAKLDGSEYLVPPQQDNTAIQVIDQILAQQMATAGAKAVFLAMNGTWSVIVRFSYHRPNPGQYWQITKFVRLYYRGDCPALSNADTLTLRLHAEDSFRGNIRNTSWHWKALPRLPNTILWRFSHESEFGDMLHPLVEINRRIGSDVPLLPACDILMNVVGGTIKKRTVKCEQDPRFFRHVTFLITCKCYHIQELVKQTWNEAAAYCHKLGAHLGTIDSAWELHKLQNSIANDDPDNGLLVPVYGNLLYLGLHTERGRWKTMKGNPPTYNEWNIPEPATPMPVLRNNINMGYVEDLQSLWHPKDDNISNCAALLYMHSEVRSSWVSIPCDREYEGRALCTICKAQETSSAVRVRAFCREGYLMIFYRCVNIKITPFALLMIQRVQLYPGTYETCHSELGDSLPEMIFLMIEDYVLFPFSSVLFIDEASNEGKKCFLLETCSPAIPHVWAEVHDVSRCNITHVEIRLDRGSLHDISKWNSCPEGAFKCATRTCISELYRCDGETDCEDGSDEINCTASCSLNTHSFQHGINVHIDCHSCHPENCSCSLLQYQCHSGGCIAADYLCDHINHCTDASDELYCNYPLCDLETEFHCGQGQCIPTDHVCDIIFDCKNQEDEMNELCLTGLCNGYQCLTGECIAKSKVNDLFPDCHSSEIDDEPELVTHPGNGTYKCSANQLPCLMFHSKCYPAELYCVYDLDAEGHLYPCRNGGHLHECSLVVCFSQFKCHLSYCIPLQKRCDGVIDCPSGEDENCNSNGTLCQPGLLKCKTTGVCLAKHGIHDGKIDCLGSHEDEMLREETCPSECICAGSAVLCLNNKQTVRTIPSSTKLWVLSETRMNSNSTPWQFLEALRILDLSNNAIEVIPDGYFMSMPNLFKLNLSRNKITNLKAGIFLGLAGLYFLSLEKNPILTLDSRFLEGAHRLPVLSLDNLPLTFIKDGAFLNATNMRVLNLSYDNIFQLREATFKGLMNLELLDLRENPLTFIDPNAFLPLTSLARLYTDDYKLCCMMPGDTWCSASLSFVSTCTDLLGWWLLKTGAYCIGLLTMLGNLWMIKQQVSKLFRQRQKSDSSLQLPLLFINLASSDMLYGIYVLVLGGVDTYYKGNFMQNEDVWERSLTCSLIGIMATTSLNMSLFVLLFLSLDQAHVILAGYVYGYIRYHISVGKLATTLFVSWGLFISLALVRQLTITEEQSQSLCLTAILDLKRDISMWRYLSLITVVFKLMACCIIALCYIAVAKISLMASRGVGKAKSKHRTPYSKLAIIVFTNVVVVITHSVIVLLSYLDHRPGMVVMLWLIAFLLPLNSLVNPYIHNWHQLASQLRKYNAFAVDIIRKWLP